MAKCQFFGSNSFRQIARSSFVSGMLLFLVSENMCRLGFNSLSVRHRCKRLFKVKRGALSVTSLITPRMPRQTARVLKSLWLGSQRSWRHCRSIPRMPRQKVRLLKSLWHGFHFPWRHCRSTPRMSRQTVRLLKEFMARVPLSVTSLQGYTKNPHRTEVVKESLWQGVPMIRDVTEYTKNATSG